MLSDAAIEEYRRDIEHLKNLQEIGQGWEPISVMHKAANFMHAIVDHAVAGFPLLKEREMVARITICESCSSYHDRTCEICGCNMMIKASWAEQKCPLDKWPTI